MKIVDQHSRQRLIYSYRLNNASRLYSRLHPTLPIFLHARFIFDKLKIAGRTWKYNIIDRTILSVTALPILIRAYKIHLMTHKNHQNTEISRLRANAKVKFVDRRAPNTPKTHILRYKMRSNFITTARYMCDKVIAVGSFRY